MRIGYDPWAISLSCRSIALWALGLPDAAKIDREQALGFKIDYAAILMSALSMVFLFNSLLIARDYAAIEAQQISYSG